MLTVSDKDATKILRFFDELPDPRAEVNRQHLLGDFIVIAICAVLAGCDGPTGIAKWAKLKEKWLREHLAPPHGVPAKDTFRRVLSLLNPRAFQQCFSQWIDSLSFLTDEQKAEHKKLIAIDGKALRRSHDKKNDLGALFIVSAWASDQGISLGQVSTEEKSNEITAIPKLLDEIRARNRNFAQNLSWLRRLTLSLIKQHPGKESNTMKRRMAGWSIDYLMQILTGQYT